MKRPMELLVERGYLEPQGSEDTCTLMARCVVLVPIARVGNTADTRARISTKWHAPRISRHSTTLTFQWRSRWPSGRRQHGLLIVGEWYGSHAGPWLHAVERETRTRHLLTRVAPVRLACGSRKLLK